MTRNLGHSHKTTNNNETPIFNACLGGHKDVVKFLFDNGADTSYLTKTSLLGDKVIRNRLKKILNPEMNALIKEITRLDTSTTGTSVAGALATRLASLCKTK